MKSIAACFIVASLVLMPLSLGAQGFRSPGGPAGNASGAAIGAGTASQSRQGPAVSVQSAPAVTNPSATQQRSVTKPPDGRFVSPTTHLPPQGVVLGTPGTSVRNTPGFVTVPPPHVTHPPHVVHPGHPSWPHYHYRYRYRPNVIILGVPYYSGTTVVTQVAPGVIQQEPRPLEAPPSESRTRGPGQLAPFDPTPQEVVERMLRLANPKAGDVLYDLGAGDGRVAIAAAKKYGIKAVGFEIDGGLVKLARENVRKQGVEKLVEIRQEDFLPVDLSPASVVTLYLSYDGNLAIRPQLMSQLKPGARVVSYTFDMAEWQPKATESYRDSAGNSHLIYLWEIGAPLAFSNY